MGGTQGIFTDCTLRNIDVFSTPFDVDSVEMLEKLVASLPTR
jgi:sialic acid synthase SpsE